MHRGDVLEARRHRSSAMLIAFVVLALAYAAPDAASAALASLEVEKEGTGAGTVISSPAGISCGLICSAEFAEGEEVTLTASPDAESEFAYWEGCDDEPEGKCRVTIDEDRAVTAVFEESEPPEYSLEINEGGEGEGEWECVAGGEKGLCEEEYPAGTHVKIIVSAYEGSKFAGFSGDCTGSTCSLVMDRDYIVTATFDLKEFALTIKKTGGTGSGKVECEREVGPELCKSKYPWETEITLIAVADAGSEFTDWQGCDRKPIPGMCEVDIDREEARTVTVTFNLVPKPEFTLAVKKVGTGTGSVTSSPAGISCGAICSAQYGEGEEITLTATASGDSEFVGWEGCASQPARGKCRIAMGSVQSAVATFDLKPKPPSPTPESKGEVAIVKRVALVRGGRALLAVHCAGGSCEGRLELTARVGGDRRRHVIGRRSFGLAPEAHGTLEVKLSEPAKREVVKRGRLLAAVKGSGVVGETVRLRRARKR